MTFFFFQAEAGKRDWLYSRGLGDVNKGQAIGEQAVAFFANSLDKPTKS